ncbi:uncharacterized protein [Fopius arisanus]|uniref:Uncharacterized protein n=1 Tax=Fopius arisanus TaxID=64838 RepID=A0A9R1T897_9HYME|nr:PREDICTED: uncharacterized protein LOC105267801 [Fopius arisanus]
MTERSSLSSRAASIVLGLDTSGRKFQKGSAVNQSSSPYFKTRPLADLTNLHMEDNCTFDISHINGMISSRVVGRREMMIKKKIISKASEKEDDFFGKLLKNMEKDVKNRKLGLPSPSVVKTSRKTILIGEGNLKLMKGFKEHLKVQETERLFSLKTNQKDKSQNQTPGTDFTRDERIHSSYSRSPQPPVLQKISPRPGYSEAAAYYESDDLFSPPIPSKKTQSVLSYPSPPRSPVFY